MRFVHECSAVFTPMKLMLITNGHEWILILSPEKTHPELVASIGDAALLFTIH